jgi:hypothetical protein
MELRRANLLVLGLCVVATAGCGEPPPGRTYYQRNIEPILVQKCAGNTSGCHSTNEADPYQFAAGNLDVTSFENIQKRRDVLAPFGAYPFPLLLIKAVGSAQLKMQYGDVFKTIDVQHSGGAILDVGSDAYFTLQSWLENGATENGLKPATPAKTGSGDCSEAIPPGFNKATYITAATQGFFDTFKNKVQPILTGHGCTAGSCHGAPRSDFYITCGNTDDQLAFNFSQAWSFVNNPVDDSQILKVPLAVGAGGRGHTGGDQFENADDSDYNEIRTWANTVGVLDFANGNPVKQFFQDNVQPLLLQRGCAFQGCHSPAAPNDFKLRSGTQGFFSAVALEKNYELLKSEFMAMEFPDARRSRAIAKTILDDDPRVAGVAGMAHRGGPVLETPGMGPADPAACPAVYNPAMSSAFCTMQEWVNRERAALGGQITPMNAGDPITIVYVERTAGTATAGRLEFDTFAGGADLKAATTQFAGADHQVQAADAGAATSLLGTCAGLTAGTADVQAPDVANDGTRVVFAARNSAAEPLGVFVVNIDGSNCVRVTPSAPDSNGIKVHNFDPAWAPDGSAIVFASTRGKSGATKSRKRFLPQSDLWRVSVTGTTFGTPEQMTFLSNSEIGPQFMREGRVTMTTEKTSDTNNVGFYQLSGRRINWDLTDYHPLLAQRKDSPYADLSDLTQTKPSIGYASATDIREGSDGNFLLILSNVLASGAPEQPGAAGALAIFNRSVGPFEAGRGDDGFLGSVRVLDGGTAQYRGPVSMPDGTIMVSRSLTAGGSSFDVISFNPRDGAQRNLFTNGGGKTRVDAVLAYKYPARTLYNNRRQLVFGGASGGDASHAVVHMPDAPMLFTLLTGNLRRGRPIDAFRKATQLVVYAEAMCGSNCTANTNGIFQTRDVLGKANLADDGSVRIRVPSGVGVVFELQDASNKPIVTMGEEHQLGPGESISMGVAGKLFDAVCGGCHGSVSGHELDVGVTADALTGASASVSATSTPALIGP